MAVRSHVASEMVERVARAICDVKTGKMVTPDYELPDNSGRKAWELCIDEARAAIEIMMEPIEAMVAAADAKDTTATDAAIRETAIKLVNQFSDFNAKFKELGDVLSGRSSIG